MKKEDLIGRKVKGFEFEKTSDGYYYISQMSDYDGKVGVIEEFVMNDSARVRFKDGTAWIYPIELVYDHLVNEDFEKERKGTLDAVNGGDYRKFDTGSVRDSDKGKPRVADMEPYTRLRFGYHMLLGAEKYNKKNYLLGQPDDSSLESIHRHLALYEDGDRSEDHLCAIMFGIQNILLNEKKDGREPSHYYNSLKESKDEK